jgi:hypothetical protein
MNNGPTDTYAASRDRVHYNNTLADLKPTNVQVDVENTLLVAMRRHCRWRGARVGDGILTATDRDGRVFKIEITQVDGPK